MKTLYDLDSTFLISTFRPASNAKILRQELNGVCLEASVAVVAEGERTQSHIREGTGTREHRPLEITVRTYVSTLSEVGSYW